MSKVAPPLPASRWLTPDYKVLACLSRGRALDVYDVWSKQRECRCVAKVLRPDRVNDRKTRRALLCEGRLLRGLCHPHIVRLYEMLREPSPVLILETLTGATLSHIIKKNHRLGLGDIAPLGIHLCSAIHYLHRHAGFLHLDLKPSNIVCERGHAKVIDFSIARRPGRGHKGVGTRRYLAPEQALGYRLTPATDVWGIGVVLFEVATGRRAFPVDDHGGYEQLKRRAESVRDHCRLPSPLAKAIDSCLEPNPNDRPRLEELTQILNRWT